MKIAVAGCGYVGLVTGACLAQIGHEVVCTDNDEQKIQTLQKGELPIFEEHLDKLVEDARRAKRLSFTTDSAAAIDQGEIVFICVGTPPLENGDADLTAIDAVARLLAKAAKAPKLVVEKSTVPVHTGQQLKRALEIYGRHNDFSFLVASNPEFLQEGTAVADFLHPDRIVIGVEEERAETMLRELYSPVVNRTFDCPVHSPCASNDPVPFISTDLESAELIKHASNSFLALKISYANALADLCEKVGGNVDEIARGMGLDPRIGPHFLRAGLGFGGFCLPKDVQAFIRVAERAGVDFALLKEAERINQGRITTLLETIRNALWVLKQKEIGILGLSFKPNTDDIRFSPALEIIRGLLAEGAYVRAFDPQAIDKARSVIPNVEYGRDAYEVAQGADALLLATEWADFRELDWQRIYDSMRRPVLFDGRNFLDPEQIKGFGFEYYSVGRPKLGGINPQAGKISGKHTDKSTV